MQISCFCSEFRDSERSNSAMNRANQKKYVFHNTEKCKKAAKKVLIFYGKLFKIELCSKQVRRACVG